MNPIAEAPAVVAADRQWREIAAQLTETRGRLATLETERITARNARGPGRADRLMDLDDAIAVLKAEIAGLEPQLEQARQHRDAAAQAAGTAFLNAERVGLIEQLAANTAEFVAADVAIATIAGRRRRLLEQLAAVELQRTGNVEAPRAVIFDHGGDAFVEVLGVLIPWLLRHPTVTPKRREDLVDRVTGKPIVTSLLGELEVKLFDAFNVEAQR